jgi:UDP-N-acetylmuramyl pentapeptide phosphotransferase/UDP-N-acetylglucosamine-1-phosphate transferase
MSVLAISFIASLIFTLWIIRYSHLHARLTYDTDMSGVQKFHTSLVPRIGGIGIVVAVFLALSVRFFQSQEVGVFGLLLATAGMPAFLFGLLEDLTKKVGIKVRLMATFVSAGAAGVLLNAWLTSLQILGIDDLMLAYPILAIGVTCIAVGGVANAFNIIDGYNGLSSMIAVIILSGIAYVAFQLNDHAIMISCFAMVGALLGFLMWNYPRGLIFLGDGGAYIVGFWIAELSVLLTTRHSEVSKWFPLLICLYPIFETLFTIYRRVILKRVHPGMPDASHLHQLIYKRIVRWSIHSDNAVLKTQRNSLTSPYLWLICLFAVIPAVLFWRNHIALKIFSILFAILYVLIYWSITHFKVPPYLILQNSSDQMDA